MRSTEGGPIHFLAPDQWASFKATFEPGRYRVEGRFPAGQPLGGPGRLAVWRARTGKFYEEPFEGTALFDLREADKVFFVFELPAGAVLEGLAITQVAAADGAPGAEPGTPRQGG